MVTEKLYKLSVNHTFETPTFSGEAVVIDNGGMSWVEMHQVDAVEVVHGRWQNNANNYPECDKCGYMPQYDPMIDDIFYSPYCPNCGAKMDGDGNG